VAKFVNTAEWRECGVSPGKYTPEFVAWVNSINHDFNYGKTSVKFEPFELYKKQVAHWLMDSDEITDYQTESDQLNFLTRESYRCQNNTLYVLDKYGKALEGQVEDGEIDLEASEAQRMVCFLVDMGLSFLLTKPRQMGLTSVIGVIAAARLNFRKNFTGKFITYNDKKVQEIFADKIKYPFGRIPDHLRHVLGNDRDNMLRVRRKAQAREKGKVEGRVSTLRVEVATGSAIVGGSPNEVYIDEAAWIECLGQMIREQRPTQFFFNPKTKLLEFKRQIMIWSSGASQKDEEGNVARGGADLESLWDSLIDQWNKGEYNSGIIPIFFNWTARLGATEKIRENEKQVYYAVQGTDRNQSIIQFHQAWPETVKDVFMRSDDTILELQVINDRKSAVLKKERMGETEYGYFRPIYDTTKPYSDKFVVPFKIVDVEWVKTTDIMSPATTAVMTEKPKKGWVKRYYQGTDPVNSETGISLFSSAIWDEYTHSVPCVVYTRERDFRQSYLQAILMGVYYDWQHRKGVPDLIEDNIGDDYKNTRDLLGFGHCVLPKLALPKSLQGGAKMWGINKKGNAGYIASYLLDLLDNYRDNIDIWWFWVQLGTFVKKSLKTIVSHRETKYEPRDRKRDRDDAIDAVTYARICAISHDRDTPRYIYDDVGAVKKVQKTRRIQNSSTGWKMSVKR